MPGDELEALESLLDSAEREDFRYHGQWLRLARLERTLALAARATAAARARPALLRPPVA